MSGWCRVADEIEGKAGVKPAAYNHRRRRWDIENSRPVLSLRKQAPGLAYTPRCGAAIGRTQTRGLLLLRTTAIAPP
jgi:hypothetical protein